MHTHLQDFFFFYFQVIDCQKQKYSEASYEILYLVHNT